MSLALLLTGFGLISARTIKGTVSDSDGELPGANVVIKGTTQGMTTDLDGKYEIEVSDGQTLVFSFVGYATQEIKVSAKTSSVLNIKMKTDDKVLDEVVVVGYGVQKKSDLTGSVSGVREDKLKETVAASVDQALQGRVSGVQVTNSSGQPGEASSVRVRGTSSLTGSNEPLYVVDGMPIGSGMQSSGSNPLAAINPADIVSMEVLKDASATAIYGARAANGVIMVTTRKGKNGDAKISYSGQLMVSEVSKKLDMMNLKEYSQFYNDPLVISAFSGTPDSYDYTQNLNYLGEGTDWQDEIFRTAIGHQHQLSISGGSEKTQYAYSFGYLNQEGIVLNTDYERFNGRVNLENQTKSWLRTGITMAYAHSNQTKQKGFELPNANVLGSLGSSVGSTDEGNPVIQSLKQKPSNSPYDMDGNYADVIGNTNSGIKMNPIMTAKTNAIYITNDNVQGNAFAQIQFMKELTWRNEFGMDYTGGEETQFASKEVARKENQITGVNRFNMYWRGMSSLTYNKRFNDKHSGSLMLATEINKASWHGVSLHKSDMMDDSMVDPDNQNFGLGTTEEISGYKGSVQMISYLGRLNYNYADRYLLTATGRYDGSSTLSKDNRWGFFPSFSLAWRINQEHFIQESSANDWISNLKLRAGYGETGNAGTGINYLTTYSQDENSMVYYQTQWLNEDLIWETNWQLNAGLDLGLFNNRISASFDFFLKRNKDLIVQAEPGSSLAATNDGYTKPADINIGSIENKGFDITINTVNIDTKIADLPFQWTTDLNFSKVKNEVVELGGMKKESSAYSKSAQRYVSISCEGEAPGMFYGYKTDGIIQNTAQLNEKVRTSGTSVGDLNFVDINDDGVIDANDKTFIGNPNPDFTFGFGNSLSYGNPNTSGVWTLSVFLNGSYGNDIFNLLKMNLEGLDETGVNYLSSALDFARVATDPDTKEQYVVNSGTDVPRPTTNAQINATVVSDRYVEDGSYLRIQNVALSYTLPKRWTDKMHVSNLKLSANVQNVYTFTNYSGYNPEVANSNAMLQGVDSATYPSPRMFVFGLNLDF